MAQVRIYVPSSVAVLFLCCYCRSLLLLLLLVSLLLLLLQAYAAGDYNCLITVGVGRGVHCTFFMPLACSC